MNWLLHHRASELHASCAQELLRNGDRDGARVRYALAGEAEERAITVVDRSIKMRTYAITLVSAAALYYKARRIADCLRIVRESGLIADLPKFARLQLRRIADVANSLASSSSSTIRR